MRPAEFVVSTGSSLGSFEVCRSELARCRADLRDCDHERGVSVRQDGRVFGMDRTEWDTSVSEDDDGWYAFAATGDDGRVRAAGAVGGRLRAGRDGAG